LREPQPCKQERKPSRITIKHRDTVKFLVGLSPNLTVNFVLHAFGGRALDQHITLSSQEFMGKLQPGSQIMADKGFNIGTDVQKLGVQLIIPDFKQRGRSQMTPEEVVRSEAISSARIHIERIIQRIRTFHVLKHIVKIAQQDIVDQMFTTCTYLTNFQMPIINFRKEVESVEPIDVQSPYDLC
jgi:hypothetical protein